MAAFLSRHALCCLRKQEILSTSKTQLLKLLHVSTASQQDIRQQHNHGKGQNPPSSYQELRPVRVSSLPRTSRRNNRRSVGEIKASKPQQFQRDGSYAEDPLMEELYEDELAEKISKYSDKTESRKAEAEFTRSLVKDARSVRLHTIKQKHFRPAPSPDLLTWKAKQQIKFLHQFDPDTWSARVLAEFFPVSERGMKEALKARHLYQEEDIFRHDQRILDNWSELCDRLQTGEITEEEVEDIQSRFFSSQGECLVSKVFLQPELPHQQERKRFVRRGEFSDIVRDYLDTQEQRVRLLMEKDMPAVKEQLSTKLKEIEIVLQKLISALNKDKKKHMSKDRVSLNVLHIDTDTSNKSSMGGKKNELRETLLNKKRKHEIRTVATSGSGSMSTTFISGKDVYDEDGEFLYRIP